MEDAWRQWRAEVELTDQFVAGVADLGTRNAGVSDLGPNGADLQLRDILVAQIAEYARHGSRSRRNPWARIDIWLIETGADQSAKDCRRRETCRDPSVRKMRQIAACGLTSAHLYAERELGILEERSWSRCARGRWSARRPPHRERRAAPRSVRRALRPRSRAR